MRNKYDARGRYERLGRGIDETEELVEYMPEGMLEIAPKRLRLACYLLWLFGFIGGGILGFGFQESAMLGAVPVIFVLGGAVLAG